MKKGLRAILLCVASAFVMYTSVVSFRVLVIGTTAVGYNVSDSLGKFFSETWKEDTGGQISAFNQNNELVNIISFNVEKDGYFESHEDTYVDLFFSFKKSPSEMIDGEAISGDVFIVNKKDTKILPVKVEASMVKGVRSLDNRIISVLAYTLNENETYTITKMYTDKENSTYYFPDERIDQLFISGKLASRVHFVAKGRKFLPIEYKHNPML